MNCRECEQLRLELEFVQEQLSKRESEVLELEHRLEEEKEKRFNAISEALNEGDGSYKP